MALAYFWYLVFLIYIRLHGAERQLANFEGGGLIIREAWGGDVIFSIKPPK